MFERRARGLHVQLAPGRCGHEDIRGSIGGNAHVGIGRQTSRVCIPTCFGFVLTNCAVHRLVCTHAMCQYGTVATEYSGWPTPNRTLRCAMTHGPYM